LSMPVPGVESREIHIVEHAFGHVEHACRAEISELISLEVVVEKAPARRAISALVGFNQVDVVRVHVDREHCLGIDLEDHERWIVLLVWGQTASDTVQEDSFLWVGDTSGHGVRLIVRVALQTETDDVLESLHEGLVAFSPLVLTASRVVMADQDGDAFVGLDLGQLFLKPLEVMARVASLA
jgi:hypothetical protein